MALRLWLSKGMVKAMTPRERAEDLARKIIKSVVYVTSECPKPREVELCFELCPEIADTLLPLLMEIDAARKMRDEFYVHYVGIEFPPEHPGYKFTLLALAYDAIRKKNEGGT